VDVDRRTFGLSPIALETWLDDNAQVDADGLCRTKLGETVIRACLPMHTFGHPVELDALIDVCNRWRLPLVEDASESVGSLYKGKHTGTFGKIGALSFNGNKVITTGGGGMILSDERIGKRAKHITTTAKVPHPYEFVHDEIGYNYRMPNLNAALGCAQLERLEYFISAKRVLASRYSEVLKNSDLAFFREPDFCRSNYWLNAVICESRKHRDELLKATNDQEIMTRPLWRLMSRLPAYIHCRKGDLSNAEWLETRVVNLPSSVLPELK
jgi:dTDP-4-amino-4,6-dideoxygalactose transaminase